MTPSAETKTVAALPGLSGRETLALFGMRGRDGEGGYYDEGYYSFASIAEGGGLPRQQVRRAVRSLARKGFAEYARGLWSEYDDGPQGAGYALTTTGRALARSLDDIAELAFWARNSFIRARQAAALAREQTTKEHLK